MLNKLAKVDYGYTAKGNRYEKSSDGKKTGAIAGETLFITNYATSAAVAVASPTYRKSLSNACKVILDYVKNGVKSTEGFNVISPKLAKAFELVSKTKASRAGFIAAGIMASVGLTYAATVGLGKLIGSAYDKIVDMKTRHDVDKAA